MSVGGREEEEQEQLRFGRERMLQVEGEPGEKVAYTQPAKEWRHVKLGYVGRRGSS